MERGVFRGGRGGPPRGGIGRGRGGFNGARGRGMGVRGGLGRGAGRGAGLPRGRGGVFNPTHFGDSDYSSNVLVVSARGRGGIGDGARGVGMRGGGGRGAFRGAMGGVPGVENKFRGRGGRGGDRGGMMGRGMGRGAGADRGALKRVQPTGVIPSKRGRYDVTHPNGYSQFQGYDQTPPEGYGPPQPAAPVSYGGQGYNNGSYGGYGAGQAQGYGGQGYGGYGQPQGYDSVGADYSSYPPAQDSRYAAQQPDPYGDYSKPTRHYEAESYSAGYGQGAATSYQTGYDDRSGYAAQAYDTSGYGAQAVPAAQQYGASYGQSRDYNQHRPRY